MFLRSKVIKIPPKRETKNIYIPEDNTSLISMRCGEQLNWVKNIVSTMNIAIPTHKTILLTHAPIVGHGGKGTHYNRLSPDKDIDELFVKWVNGEFKFQKDPRVEAVFCGHTHENHIFYDVETDGMDSPYELLKPYNKNGISAYATATIYFANTVPQPSDGICGAPVYIETITATKNG